MSTSSTTTRTGGHVVVEAALAAGTNAVFAIHGVQIDPIFQACADLGVRLVDVRHETSAGFAAEAYARITGHPGVAAVCPGPGFTNVLTSMANAQVDRTPVLYVVGSPPDTAQATNGLQVALDHAAIAAPLAKWTCRVTRPDRLARLVAQALRIASTAPCGPVLLDVPADVLEAAAGEAGGMAPVQVAAAVADAATVARGGDLLAAAARPALLIGHTPSTVGRAAIAALARSTGIPVFCNYGAIGALADDDDHYGGTSYQLGRLPADARPDVLAAIGTQLGFDTPGLHDGGAAWGTALLHVDGDPAEIGRFGPTALGAVADPDAYLVALAEHAATRTWPARDDWRAAVRKALRSTRDQLHAIAPSDGARVHPYAAARLVADAVAVSGAVLVGDGAVCKHWLHDALRLPAGGRYLSHGRFGCMGMGPGLSMGAAVAAGRPVVCVTGDGAVGFALGEFEAIVRHGMPITFVVMNNARWGASMGFQHRPDGPGRTVGTELSDADYHAAMVAFGGDGVRVDTIDGLRDALASASVSGRPTCINVSVNSDGLPPEVPLLNA